jgi:hypothetical protein
MVRKERASIRIASSSPSVERASSPASASSARSAPSVDPVETAPTGQVPLVPVAQDVAAAEGLWDPVPVTLPTYVSKPPARRSVRTIDLDATGVWTSGRSESDSVLAREAEAAERVRRQSSRTTDTGEEAVGS